MAEITPCLLRIGDNVKKYKLLKLDREQVTIGRTGDVTYALLSNMISRHHASIKRKDDKTWEITDNKSLNGVYVNGRELTPFTPYTLQDGDMVQLGRPIEPELPAEFVYKFYSALKVRIEKKSKRFKVDDSMECEERKDTLGVSESEESEADRDRKRKKPNCESGSQSSPQKVLRERMEESQKLQAAKEAEYQAKLAEMERLLKEREEKEQEFQKELEKERQEKENQAKEVEELRLKVLAEMKDKEDLEKEREELKKKMQEEMEQSVREREAALMAQLSAQRDALLDEKKQVEESLQKEMEKALEEKNKELEQQLLEQKDKLDKILEKKDMEQKVLESQLNETKEESATAKVQALKAREDVLSNFVDLMEMELQCAICNELFIKATSLNCSHVFCKLCIAQWCKVKKECPNCRAPVTTQMQALALDNYIDKMVEQLSDELKERRKELIEARKVEQDKFDGKFVNPPAPAVAAVPAAAPAVPSTSGRGRRGARTRGGRSRRGNRRGDPVPAQPTATNNPTPPVQSTSATPATATAGTVVIVAATATDNNAANTDVNPVAEVGANAVIELSSDRDSDDDSDEIDPDDIYARRRWGRIYDDDDDDDGGGSDSSEEGDPDVYYGGYGRCYNCGRRGHWANGCPN